LRQTARRPLRQGAMKSSFLVSSTSGTVRTAEVLALKHNS
jgi:hypothetical protein